ncbi:hypothetical protein LCGC14_2393010, partial [marine sediment metagenome]
NPVDTPLISIPQNDIILIKTDTAEYAFNSSSLLYNYDFSIELLRNDIVQLYENVHYTFNADLKTITLIGFYRDYSGLLFSDITYDAFEWKIGSISTLQPITLSFTEDYTNQITKYLEFVIGFNEIPGYDIEKIDTNSGRLVLSEEQKSASSLNIYLFNFQKEAWDLVNFVVYDDYTGTNNFSYVIDRNFIQFEQYFNKTGLEEFQIKAIFTIEENIEDSFVSTTSLDIASIGANVYYNTPNTEHVVNPELEFDIDLTEYYDNPEIYLEQIKATLDYAYSIDFDDSFLFSEYTLLQEQINLYLRNEYMEFEVVNLDGDGFSLSRKELDRLIYHDARNGKYYLRAKLEYDWNCIIEMNLGSNSKLDIISRLDLINYDLSVSYTSYETTRISAQEINTAYNLVAIYAPNYLENSQSVYAKEDDDEIDIGVFGGFLRNSDSEQRLMLRQRLYYDFFESQEGMSTILLDQEYTDAQLRYVVPYGSLIEPSNYLTNTTQFKFAVDEDVSSVELYYHDRQQFIKKDNMDISSTSLYTYTWYNASG